MSSFGKVPLGSSVYFLISFVFYFLIRFHELLLYFEYYCIFWMAISFGNVFPFSRLSFHFCDGLFLVQKLLSSIC